MHFSQADFLRQCVTEYNISFLVSEAEVQILKKTGFSIVGRKYDLQDMATDFKTLEKMSSYKDRKLHNDTHL